MAKKAILVKKDLEDKLDEQNIDVDKILILNPRKTIVGISNPYLASELAYHLARFTSLNVLVIDADGLMPKISSALGLKETINNKVDSDINTTSSFNMALDYIAKSARPVLDVFKSIAVEHSKLKNLHVFTGNDDLSRYDGFSETAFELLLKQAVSGYDVVIVSVPFNIYDAFFLKTLENVDFMVHGFKANADNLKAYNDVLGYLTAMGRTEFEKHQYVAYEYIPSVHLLKNDIKNAVGGHFIGSISYEEKREIFNNDFYKSYSSSITKRNLKEYHRLAKAFGYSTKPSNVWNMFSNKKG